MQGVHSIGHLQNPAQELAIRVPTLTQEGPPLAPLMEAPIVEEIGTMPVQEDGAMVE